MKLIKENPDLPIVPVVNGILREECGYWLGSWGDAYIDDYLIKRNGEYVFYKSDDDIYDSLEHFLTDEEFKKLPESDEEYELIYENLPWKKKP